MPGHQTIRFSNRRQKKHNWHPFLRLGAAYAAALVMMIVIYALLFVPKQQGIFCWRGIFGLLPKNTYIFNPLEVLGLTVDELFDNSEGTTTFSTKSIKRQYRRAVMVYHIDWGPGDLRNHCPNGYPRELWSKKNCYLFVHKAMLSYIALTCLASCTTDKSGQESECLEECAQVSHDDHSVSYYSWTECRSSSPCTSLFSQQPSPMKIPGPGDYDAWSNLCLRAVIPPM